MPRIGVATCKLPLRRPSLVQSNLWCDRKNLPLFVHFCPPKRLDLFCEMPILLPTHPASLSRPSKCFLMTSIICLTTLKRIGRRWQPMERSALSTTQVATGLWTDLAGNRLAESFHRCRYTHFHAEDGNWANPVFAGRAFSADMFPFVRRGLSPLNDVNLWDFHCLRSRERVSHPKRRG